MHRISGLDESTSKSYSAPIQVAASEQLSLRLERNWGGARKGAGRPKSKTPRRVPHRARPVHKARYPLHVTVRVRGGMPSFREPVIAKVVVATISAAHRETFRVLHYSVQDNHVHLIVEAQDATSLARGMQRLNACIARNVNDGMGIHGPVWRERYHARELRAPRSVRNALVYVLMNAKKHGHRFASGLDELSSAAFFDGLREHVPNAIDSPVRAPRTWLANVGWRRNGLIRSHEQPRSPG